MSDYLAIIYIGGGSSWGRGSDKDSAVKNAVKSLRDWKTLYKVSNVMVTVNVFETEGHDDIAWDDLGFWADGKKFKPTIETVKCLTPNWR
jgi:hypothetical protein